jgi:exopolyphosphatase/guanosine-5'-triphosphate,3'-diphosphate pyrophosphatase
MTKPSMVAAVDLGSNSFHMVVARLDQQQLVIVDRLREPVRLGEGLTDKKSLKSKVGQRALACLERFGQRLRDLPHDAVRAVGTNTMRQIADGGKFLRTAQQALGHPINIISGQEEARMVYLGVAHGLAGGNDKRLVIDIGGGSTELIIGQDLSPHHYDSLYMGCVSMTKLAFSDGVISHDKMHSALLRCALELRPVKRMYRNKHWQIAMGSSGTIRSIRKVVMAQGWSEEGITASSLSKLRSYLIEQGHVDKLKLEGLSDERRPVFTGGVAVLSALFEALKIETMQVSDAALREGLLYELLGYIQHRDIRENTVQSLAERFTVDQAQAKRIEKTGIELLKQVKHDWQLTHQEDRLLLRWACRLHEVGLSLSHNGFHKHGAYILENANLPGFSRQQQARLAMLVRNHRRKFNTALFSTLASDGIQTTERLCILLRLAVLLHRGRADDQPGMTLTVKENSIKISLPDDWLERHPLTQIELENEAVYLEKAGFSLAF